MSRLPAPMSDTEAAVASDLLDEPHVAGRRVPVRTLRDRVEVAGDAPTAVAERFDLDPTTVYRALAYYHEHRGAFASARARREAAHERFRQRRAEAAGEAAATDD